MCLQFANKKLVLLWLFFVFLIINLKGSIEAQDTQTETIVKEDYSFTIESDSEVIRRAVFGGEIRCGRREKEQILEIKEGFNMTIEDKYLTEMLTAFGVEIDIGTDQARLKAMTEIRNQLARGTKFVTEKGISSTITEKVPIKERQCYNQTLFLEFTRKNFKIDAKKRRLWKDLTFNFSWDDEVDQHVVIVAEYDETCSAQCQIKGKKTRVKGKNDTDQWAKIPYKDREIYLIPLYWGIDGRLLEVIPLLPEDVRTKDVD